MSLLPLIYALNIFYDIPIPKLDAEKTKFGREPFSKFGHISKILNPIVTDGLTVYTGVKDTFSGV